MSQRSFQDVEPTDMSWTEAGEARIVWSDGHESVYAPDWLRRICPCASCLGTHEPEPRKPFRVVTQPPDPHAARKQIEIRSVEPVGNYAILFHWGDGHSEGIYSWSWLRAHCPCDRCTERREEGEGDPRAKRSVGEPGQ